MIFVGTALGHIFCLPTDNPTTEASFELDPNAGLLNGLLSGFFNRGKPQHVEQLVELRFMDTSFLCSIHCGAILRLWDVTTRKMIHSCDLIPPEEAAAHKATLARVAGKRKNQREKDYFYKEKKNSINFAKFEVK